MRISRPAFGNVDPFCDAYDLEVPILLAPMAGACPPGLSIEVARAGGMGACGALLLQPTDIVAWVEAVRAQTSRGFQINLWIPDPTPVRDAAAELAVRQFLERWVPRGDAAPVEPRLPDFDAQCATMLELRPRVISSIMGLYGEPMVEQMRERGIAWFATATTVAEAIAADRAGADAIVAQGMEAGGHRGAFDAARAAIDTVGLFALLPAIVDAVHVPVIAAGGIADSRAIAAALLLGASAVMMGTGFLRSPEAQLPAAWADAIGRALPEDTMLTRAFSGRTGRAIATSYARGASSPDAPPPAPYPVQRFLTQPLRAAGVANNDIDRMQAWAGQSAARARAVPAGRLVEELWSGARELLD